jgi:hypothetical protein
MTTTVTYPADPVTNGASEIQATVFAVVAADYTPLSWNAAQRYVQERKSDFVSFPKGAKEDTAWQFYIRKDMSGTTAGQRNMLGVRVTSRTSGATGFSVTTGNVIRFNVQRYTIEVLNWFCAILTLTDTTTLPVWEHAAIAYPCIVDPESGAILAGVGAYRSILEAMGFALTQVAANSPSNAPAMNALSGIFPLA